MCMVPLLTGGVTERIVIVTWHVATGDIGEEP